MDLEWRIEQAATLAIQQLLSAKNPCPGRAPASLPKYFLAGSKCEASQSSTLCNAA